MNGGGRLGTAPLWRLMFSLALPTMAAQVANLLYCLVDRVYLGHIPDAGSAALTGVGVTLPVTVLVSAFSLFVGNGGAPLSAIWLGKGDRDRAERILGCGAALLGVFSAALMAFFLVFLRPVLAMFGASEATMPYAEQYLSWYLAGTPAVLVALGLNPYILFQGHSRTSMVSVLIGAGLNLTLDPLFIFGFGWGVRGAAVATVLSQAASAAWVLAFLTGRRAEVRLRAGNLRLDGRLVRPICALGVSPFVMRSTESLITVVMNRGLLQYGGDVYVGSLTVMQAVMAASSAVLHGFTGGVQPVLSYNFGAGNFGRVRSAYRRLIALSGGFSFVATLLVMVFPEVFARIFTSDPELVALVGRKMPLFVSGMLVFGLQMGIQPTFVALGQAKVSLFIALLRKVFLLVPLALVLPRFLGADGVYLAEPVSDFCSAAAATALFCFRIRNVLSHSGLDDIR